MNARGKKEQTRYIPNTGFSYFSQLDNVSKARCVLFWGRGDDWEGILGPHWLAALRCSCAPAALRALLIWRVNVEGASERGPAVSEKRRSLFQEESGVYWLPGWENLLWMKEDNMQGSLLRQWFKRKKKREREKDLTFGARLGRCILLLLLSLLLFLPLPCLPSGKASLCDWDCIVCDRFGVHAPKFVHV